MTDLALATYHDIDAILAKRTPPPDGVFVLDSSWYTPSSNTGCTALVDYLTISVSLLSFQAFGRNDLGAAHRLLKRCFPESSLLARDFQEHGFQGYRFSADIYGPDCEQPCGKIAYGGNNETLCVSLSGAGCPFIGSHEQLAKNLHDLDAHITRVDLAFDDFEGEYFDINFMAYLAATDYFTSDNGKRPKIKFVDDLGRLAGRTLYVGAKGDRELCIYEKGKQLQDSRSRWIRCEVRLWSKNKKIPLSTLTNGGAFMRGAYPGLNAFLPLRGSTRCATTRASSVATVKAEDEFIKNTIGRTLRLRQESMPPAQFDVYISELLSNTGMPRRWNKLPEVVVKKLIGEHADRELNNVTD
jgi:phage replication initiation protein